MPRTTTVVLGLVAAVGVVALGLAVAGLAAPNGATAVAQGTSEETHESTSESSTTTKWRAVLSARSEVPRPKGVKRLARGTFAVSVTEQGGHYDASYTLSFRRLTGRAVAAHVHRGKPGKAGPVLLALCGPCISGKKGTASLSKKVVAAMQAGAAYVNVHTKKNPAGEIRGQVKPR